MSKGKEATIELHHHLSRMRLDGAWELIQSKTKGRR